MAFSANDAAGAGVQAGWWRVRYFKAPAGARKAVGTLIAALQHLHKVRDSSQVRDAAEAARDAYNEIWHAYMQARAKDANFEAALQKVNSQLQHIIDHKDDAESMRQYTEAVARGHDQAFSAEDRGESRNLWGDRPARGAAAAPAPQAWVNAGHGANNNNVRAPAAGSHKVAARIRAKPLPRPPDE